MKVDPLASVAVITAPRVAPERTTLAPNWSVVVTTSVALVRRVLPLGTGASTELTTSPFWLTATLATGDVVETVEPRELVVTTTTPGKRAEVVIARPSELVVMKVCSTLTDADCWKAEVVSTTVLPWLFVLDRTTGTITPEAVEAAAEVLEAAIWREAVAEVTMVLPAELVEVMATTVGSMELAAELSADDAAAELSEEAADEDATTDEPRPEETAAEEEDRAEESEEASEGEVEDCAAEEDAAAEESEFCWEETELWAAEEASEDEVRVEVTRLEPEVETTRVCERDAGEAEIDTEADEADGESALLSPPVVLD
jgi:cobalamin biosynthesis protein CobT